MLQNVFERRPDFLRRCFQYLAVVAWTRGNTAILDWESQFGIKLHSTEPIRKAVSRGDVKMLQWFFDNGFEVTDPYLLKVAVDGRQLEVVCWLWEHGYTVDSLDLVKIAGKYVMVTMMRWLVEHGPPLDLSTAKTLVLENRHIEIAWWVAENDRRHLVLEALQKNDRSVVWWILAHTQFRDESARRSIRDAIQHSPKAIQQWFEDNMSQVEACHWWSMTSIQRRKEESGETGLPSSKRRRCDEGFAV
ncbi:hypothetical protein PF007_g27978 [Phytophthora fragariae]|uniref:Uncharacterized protein n=1 Tax=Phytophthora fragariae TaxID=53985 RepID=A0A6A3Q2I1_9STRA|nr:hypothetical protein PF007_g27978 [Phytophthora fragariae]